MAKMSDDQWAAARKRWESDPRDGYTWLIKEMALPVKAETIGRRVKAEGWAKAVKPKRKPKKSGVGRPTLYSEEYNDTAHRMCLLGATDKDLAEAFGVSEQTIITWRAKHPGFLESVKKGKEIADARVAESLFKRANGFVAPDTHFAVINSKVVETPTKKVYPPDTVACIFWLKNRQPHLWRDKVEVDQKSEIKFVDEKYLDAFYDRMMQSSNEKSAKVANRKAENLKRDEE